MMPTYENLKSLCNKLVILDDYGDCKFDVQGKIVSCDSYNRANEWIKTSFYFLHNCKNFLNGGKPKDRKLMNGFKYSWWLGSKYNNNNNTSDGFPYIGTINFINVPDRDLGEL